MRLPWQHCHPGNLGPCWRWFISSCSQIHFLTICCKIGWTSEDFLIGSLDFLKANWTLQHVQTHTLAPYAGPCMDDKQKYLSFISPKSKQDTRRQRYLWRKARSLVILHRCISGILKCSLERGALANICIRQSVTTAPSFCSSLTGLLEAAEHTLAWHPCLKWTDTINPRDSGDLLTKQDKVSGGARRYTWPVAHEHSWAFIAYTVYLKRRMPTSCICLLRNKHTLLCSLHSCFHSRIAPFLDELHVSLWKKSSRFYMERRICDNCGSSCFSQSIFL